MNSALYNPDPPGRCRATQSPGQGTGIGAKNTRLTTGDSIKSRVDPRPDQSDVAGVLDTLPRFLVELLNNPPRAGSGLHQWIFRCARHLLVHFDESAIVELILEKAQHSGRPPERLAREVRSQVRGALAHMWLPTFPDRYALRRERVAEFQVFARRSAK